MDIAASKMNALIVKGFTFNRALTKTAKRFAISEQSLLEVYNKHFQ